MQKRRRRLTSSDARVGYRFNALHSGKQNGGVELINVVEKVFQSLAPSGPVAFQVVCDDVDLTNNHALALGMIANELVTNSLKYAFPGDRPGHIAVAFTVGDGLELSVCDNGAGVSDAADPGGLGSRIVHLLTQQLEGEVAYERLDPGLRVRVRACPR